MKSIPMNINFNMDFLSKFTPYLYIGLFFFTLNFLVGISLAKEGVDYIEKEDDGLSYKKYNYYKNNTIFNSKVSQKSKIISLENYKLTSIYRSKTVGIISLVNKGNRSFILLIGEEIDGFVLKEIYSKHVLFEKNSKVFKLEIKNKSSLEAQSVVKKDNKSRNDFVLNRNIINNLIENPNEILKEFYVDKNVVNNKIEGFKVFKLKKNSFFSKLGLLENDIIKKVNNEILNSNKAFMKIYSNIDDLKYLKIELLRNNKITELNYEIN